MKIKTFLIVSALALGFYTSSNAIENQTNETAKKSAKKSFIASGNYSVDKSKSDIKWKGTMTGVFSHTGTLALIEGSVKVKNGKITKGSFTVDMNSILTSDSDDNYKNAPREDLVFHLKSDDFFAVEKYPTATFKITKHSGNEISGDLTIRGITSKETMTNVKLTETDDSFSATGNLVFDRQKYKVSYKNRMGDMVISDDIELTISISGVKE